MPELRELLPSCASFIAVEYERLQSPGRVTYLHSHNWQHVHLAAIAIKVDQLLQLLCGSTYASLMVE